MAVKYRPGVGRHVCRLMSVDMSTEARQSIGQYIGRHSADMSADMLTVY